MSVLRMDTKAWMGVFLHNRNRQIRITETKFGEKESRGGKEAIRIQQGRTFFG